MSIDSIQVINSTKDDNLKFIFEVNEHFSSYPNIFQKERIKLLEKWGLTNMELLKFRFNLNFNQVVQNQFLKELLNSQIIRNSCSGISNITTNSEGNLVETIKYKQLSTKSVNLDVLDVVYSSRIVNKETGYIKKDFEESYEGIQISDKLKGALVNPDDENYSVFDEGIRNEFLFRIFKHVSIGGSLCQYEDYAGEYFNMTKVFYKDLVSASKDGNTSQVYIRSLVFEIEEVNGRRIFRNSYNPQNFLYVIVDPYQKSVNLWYNKWESFW